MTRGTQGRMAIPTRKTSINGAFLRVNSPSSHSIVPEDSEAIRSDALASSRHRRAGVMNMDQTPSPIGASSVNLGFSAIRGYR